MTTNADSLSDTSRTSRVRRIGILGVALLGMVFLLLRVVHLAADFPAGISSSGDLYTDEGWYANAAISFHLAGRWYTPGDFNPIVNLPLFQFVQAASTGLWGLSLVSARLTIVISFMLIVVLGYRLVVRSFGTGIALLACLLLATNMLLFAYSRFAIIEIPMTTLMLATVVLLSGTRPGLLNVAGAACCLCLALLMKTTAVSILPVVAYLVWASQTHWQQKVLQYGMLTIGLLIVLLYHGLAHSWYPIDYVYFNTRNVTERVSFGWEDVIRNAIFALWEGRIIDRIAYTTTLVAAPALCLSVLRRSRVAMALAIWIVSYLGLISLTSYHPARYYVPLAVPILLLCAICVGTLWNRTSTSWVRLLFAAFLVLVVGLSATKVIDYVRTPRYTYSTMASDIKQHVAASDHPDGILMGDIANTISLATGQPSINATWGTRDAGWKLEQYKPDFYVSLGQDTETRAIIEADYGLNLLGTYDVFDNYYQGKRVYFYAIQPRTNDGRLRSRGDQ